MTEAALLELKTVGTEVKLRIKEHEDMLQNYSASIRINELDKADEYYTKILEINKNIDALLTKIKKIESRLEAFEPWFLDFKKNARRFETLRFLILRIQGRRQAFFRFLTRRIPLYFVVY